MPKSWLKQCEFPDYQVWCRVSKSPNSSVATRNNESRQFSIHHFFSGSLSHTGCSPWTILALTSNSKKPIQSYFSKADAAPVLKKPESDLEKGSSQVSPQSDIPEMGIWDSDVLKRWCVVHLRFNSNGSGFLVLSTFNKQKLHHTQHHFMASENIATQPAPSSGDGDSMSNVAHVGRYVSNP